MHHHMTNLRKMPAPDRKAIMKIMGLTMSSKAADLMEYLMEPQDKGMSTMVYDHPYDSQTSLIISSISLHKCGGCKKW